jgi:excisionase family DNA binding protein
MAVPRNDHLLTTSEVAALFGVESKTVSRWAIAGKLSAIRTLGGHRRYRASQIHALFDASEWAGIVDVTDTHAGIIDIRDRAGD